MDTLNSNKLSKRIWGQLDHHQWPDELASIKPSKWDGLDANHKGKLVLENLGQIIYQITLLSNQQPDQGYLTNKPVVKKPQLSPQAHTDYMMQANYIYP
ncbi:MAG: hypothetical protein ACXW1P_03375 [Methylophilaceae bacterium]